MWIEHQEPSKLREERELLEIEHLFLYFISKNIQPTGRKKGKKWTLIAGFHTVTREQFSIYYYFNLWLHQFYTNGIN